MANAISSAFRVGLALFGRGSGLSPRTISFRPCRPDLMYILLLISIFRRFNVHSVFPVKNRYFALFAEIGCATGFSSLYLGLNGRKIGGLDFSQEMLNIFSAQAKQLGIQDVMTFCANVKNRLPIEDNSWDVVFHAGLVEHFTEDEVQFIINENRRIAKRLVVSMVPNANSVAYRLGKIYKEKNGQWFAGIENPKTTQANYFITAGLKNIKEYSIDLESALWFLPETHCFSSVLRTIYRNLPTDDNCNQGYLLVTIGEK